MAKLMTLEEVADYLRVTQKTVYRLLARDGIPAVRVGQQWRFDQMSIDEWLYRNSVGTRANILVVDDEETVRLLFQRVLRDLGHQVIVAEDGNKGLRLVQEEDFDLVFLDLMMPGMDGAELFRRIKTIRPNLPVTVVTGYPDSDMMARALAHGPLGVIKKPLAQSDIISVVANSLRITQMEGASFI